MARNVTPIDEWKKSREDVFDLPSGKSMRLRNQGMRVFIKHNLIPNSLLPIVQKSLDTGTAPDMSEIITPEGVDDQFLQDMMRMVDNIVIVCAVEPQVREVPVFASGPRKGEPNEAAKKSTELYVDEIDDEDKMFIFQWATGGTRDLEQFRREFEVDVASVAGRPLAKVPAKRAPRNR